jgi:hypothetical protein
LTAGPATQLLKGRRPSSNANETQVYGPFSPKLGALLLGFDVTSGWATLVYVIGGLLLVVAILEKLFGWGSWIKRKLRPEPETPAEAPIIVLGHPGYTITTETITERRVTPLNYLTRLDPDYVIENKEALITVTDLTTGARRKDGSGEHAFDNFKAAALAPLHTAPVRNVSVPRDLFDGLTDQDYETAFVFWAHFTAPGGIRWEVAYDPQTGDHERTRLEDTS